MGVEFRNRGQRNTVPPPDPRTLNPDHSPLRIANLTLDPPILLAPMAGYSDLAFRSGMRELGGVGLAFTEMLSPGSLLQGKGQKRKTLLATCDSDQPLGHQIYGSHEGNLCLAAQ